MTLTSGHLREPVGITEVGKDRMSSLARAMTPRSAAIVTLAGLSKRSEEVDIARREQRLDGLADVRAVMRALLVDAPICFAAVDLIHRE